MIDLSFHSEGHKHSLSLARPNHEAICYSSTFSLQDKHIIKLAKKKWKGRKIRGFTVDQIIILDSKVVSRQLGRSALLWRDPRGLMPNGCCAALEAEVFLSSDK